MTIRIPDGVARSVDLIADRESPARDGTHELARWCAVAHPVEREQRLRERLNDPDLRDEYVLAEVFGDNVHDLFWGVGPAAAAVQTVGPSPIPLHIGNYTQTLGSYGFHTMDRWNSKIWAMFALRFATGYKARDKEEEIKRRRMKSHPEEWTRLDTLEKKGGDYGAPDWVHESGNPGLVVYECDYTHGWTGLR